LNLNDMNNSSLLFLLFFCLALMACDDGAEPSPVVPEPDAVHPVVSLTSPAPSDTLLVYEKNEIKVSITDNMYLRDVRVYVAVPECDSGCIPQMMAGESVDFSRGSSNKNWSLIIDIPPGAFMGTHIYSVEAEDGQKNVTKESFTFTVHAPDLDLARFSSVIAKGVFGKIDDNDGFLNYDELGAALYGRVHDGLDMEAEVDQDDWHWFVDFYGLENQTWADWDTNGDDILQSTEFSRGLEKAGFLVEWDVDGNNLLSEEEFAGYLFSRLDFDGNGVLNGNEYVQGYKNNLWL
jgi:hypothetical protein